MADPSSDARVAGLRRNPKLLFWKNFFQFGMFLNPAWPLFLLSRGIDRQEIFLLGLVYAVITVIAEVPSGFIGDRFGRRRTLLAGTVVLVAGATLQIWAAGFVFLAAVMACRAIGDALHSGTEESLIVDSACELGHAEEVLHDANVGSAGHHLAKSLTPVVFLAASFLWTGDALFTALAALTAFSSALAIGPILRTTEPAHGSRRGLDALRESLRVFRRHPILLGFTLHGGLRFTTILLFFLAYPARLSGLGFGVVALGAFYVVFHLAMYAHARVAHRLDAWRGAPKLVNGMTAACLLLGAASAVFDLPPVVYAACLATFIVGDARGAYYVHHVNRFIPSDVRATTLSLMRLVQRVIETPVMIAAAWLAAGGIEGVLWLFVGLNAVLLLVPFPSSARIAAARGESPP